MRDEKGEWWGWENVKPRDLRSLSAALLAGARQWHGYSILDIGSGS